MATAKQLQLDTPLILGKTSCSAFELKPQNTPARTCDHQIGMPGRVFPPRSIMESVQSIFSAVSFQTILKYSLRLIIDHR